MGASSRYWMAWDLGITLLPTLLAHSWFGREQLPWQSSKESSQGQYGNLVNIPHVNRHGNIVVNFQYGRWSPMARLSPTNWLVSKSGACFKPPNWTNRDESPTSSSCTTLERSLIEVQVFFVAKVSLWGLPFWLEWWVFLSLSAFLDSPRSIWNLSRQLGTYSH